MYQEPRTSANALPASATERNSSLLLQNPEACEAAASKHQILKAPPDEKACDICRAVWAI